MRRSSLIALLTASALSGCFIVTDNPDDDDNGNAGETGEGMEQVSVCADPGTNSVETPTGDCVCEEGLVWCTDDPDDVTCCAGACGDPGTNSQEVVGGDCECVAGFGWCTDNPMDVSCCAT